MMDERTKKAKPTVTDSAMLPGMDGGMDTGRLGQGLSEAAEIMQLTRAIIQSQPGEPQHERFRRLCEVIFEAYPDREHWSNAAIREHPATGPLIRYLVAAAAGYLKKCNSEAETVTKNESRRRAEWLAEAFGIVGKVKKGTILRGWAEDDQVSCVNEFWCARIEARRQGLAPRAAWQEGFRAALERLRDGREEISGTERKQHADRVRSLLERCGQPEPPADLET